LGQTPLTQKISPAVQIVRGDSSGALWVGLLGGGLIRYDPDNKTSMHFGAIYEMTIDSSKDTSNGLSQLPHSRQLAQRGMYWVINNRGIIT
jgi:hypothetical protein